MANCDLDPRRHVVKSVALVAGVKRLRRHRSAEVRRLRRCGGGARTRRILFQPCSAPPLAVNGTLNVLAQTRQPITKHNMGIVVCDEQDFGSASIAEAPSETRVGKARRRLFLAAPVRANVDLDQVGVRENWPRLEKMSRSASPYSIAVIVSRAIRARALICLFMASVSAE